METDQFYASKVYIDLVAPLIESLLTEVMVLGLLAVTFSYAVEAYRNSRECGKYLFEFLLENIFLVLKRGWLLLIISMFAAYDTISYAVWAKLEPTSGAVEGSKALVLLALPFDLMQVAIIAALFGVLSAEATPWSSQPTPRKSDCLERDSVLRELRALFFFTGAWHLDIVIWWVLYGVISNDGEFIASVLTHAPFAVIYFILFFVSKRILRSTQRSSKVWENALLVAYSTLLLTFYVYRLGQHVDMHKDILSS